MIFLILILATTLRLININQSLWLDEAINVVASQNFTFWDFVTKYPIGDFHPPGYFVLLWIWTRIGGTGEIWVRLPSVFFGIGTVWVIYLLGKELFSKRVGLTGSILLALAPLHVYYSQEARMYAMATFVVTLSFYFFWKLVKGEERGRVDWVGYTGCNILVLYSDYLAYLIFPVQLIYLVIWKRSILISISLSWMIGSLAIFPWIPVFLKQLSSGASAVSTLPGWASIVGGTSLKELFLIPVKTFFGKISIDNNLIFGAVSSLVGLFYGALIFNGAKKSELGTRMLILWISFPIILAFIISFFVPILSYFRLLFISPAFCLLLAKGVEALHSRETPWRLTLWMICLVSIVSLAVYYTNPSFYREDWRGAVKKADQLAQKSGLIIFENDNLPYPFIYYSENKSPAIGGLKKLPARFPEDIKELPNTENIYLFEYLVDITDPKRVLEKRIEEKYKKVKTLNFNGVGFVHHYQLQ